jgi:hypothetical protein
MSDEKLKVLTESKIRASSYSLEYIAKKISVFSSE